MHSERKSTHGRESVESVGHYPAGPPSLSAEITALKPPQEEAAELRAHFKSSRREVSHRLRSHDLTAPRELLPVIDALTALNFPVTAATSGFEPSTRARFPGFPTVTIRESARPFELRFDGQREAFAQALKEISVPLSLRCKNILTLGLTPLTPELCPSVLTPANEQLYPRFSEMVQKAYEKVLAETSGNKPTEDEALRRECNVALALRLKSYLKEFQTDYRASPGVPITLDGRPGDAVTIVAGEPYGHDGTSGSSEPQSLRARIISERQKALTSFGAFLKERALAGR